MKTEITKAKGTALSLLKLAMLNNERRSRNEIDLYFTEFTLDSSECDFHENGDPEDLGNRPWEICPTKNEASWGKSDGRRIEISASYTFVSNELKFLRSGTVKANVRVYRRRDGSIWQAHYVYWNDGAGSCPVNNYVQCAEFLSEDALSAFEHDAVSVPCKHEVSELCFTLSTPK